MVWGTVFVALTVMSVLEHDHVKPLPGSRVVVDDERDGELVVTYRDAGSRVRKTIPGRVYSLEYEVSRDVTAEDVVEFFTAQAEGLEGGDVHRTTENRVTFSFRRSDGGTTWCDVWATDGNYTLEIVDETPDVVAEPEHAEHAEREREPEPEPESSPSPSPTPPPAEPPVPDDAGAAAADMDVQVVARLVFDETSETLPPGAGAILDDVATRLKHAPDRRLEIRALGDQGPRRAETVRSALLLFGIASERLTIVSGDSADGESPNRLELALRPAAATR